MMVRIEHGADEASAMGVTHQQVRAAINSGSWFIVSCSVDASGQLIVSETTFQFPTSSMQPALKQLMLLVEGKLNVADEVKLSDEPLPEVDLASLSDVQPGIEFKDAEPEVSLEGLPANPDSTIYNGPTD